jgi:hypothetical protein
METMNDEHAVGTPFERSGLLGSAYRGTVDRLNAAALAFVCEANLRYIRSSDISPVEANVIYAIAEKSTPGLPE